jgi:hypothetical protein
VIADALSRRIRYEDSSIADGKVTKKDIGSSRTIFVVVLV